MPYQYKDKKKNISQLDDYMLTRTLGMFEYTGLPKTIPAKELERIIQTAGMAYITECNGELYAFRGTLGGVQDAYGRPVDIVIANTYLNFYKTLNVEEDGVLIRNDDCYMGIMPLVNKANTMIAENDVSMTIWGINSRIQKTISAPDDTTRASAELYLKRTVDGELAVIGDNALFDGVKVQSNATHGVSITEMIEYNQYLKASLYNELGISSNFNMKRERLVSGEVDQNEDSLFPFVYAMFQCRLEAVAKINEKYGTEITVDFGSVWKLKQIELERELDEPENEGSDPADSESSLETVHSQEVIDDNDNGSEAKPTTPEPEPTEPEEVEEEPEQEPDQNPDPEDEPDEDDESSDPEEDKE